MGISAVRRQKVHGKTCPCAAKELPLLQHLFAKVVAVLQILLGAGEGTGQNRRRKWKCTAKGWGNWSSGRRAPQASAAAGSPSGGQNLAAAGVRAALVPAGGVPSVRTQRDGTGAVRGARLRSCASAEPDPGGGWLCHCAGGNAAGAGRDSGVPGGAELAEIPLRGHAGAARDGGGGHAWRAAACGHGFPRGQGEHADAPPHELHGVPCAHWARGSWPPWWRRATGRA